MKSEIENWMAKAEAWRRHADLSRKRAAIVRKVAVMMRGTEPLPDGLTRAALVVCGTAWRGFEWVRRGVEVSPAVWEVERNAAADKLAFYAGEVAREAGKVSDAFHAADVLAALRGESLTPPAEWTSPALERLRPIRDAVAGTLDSLNEEGEAWRDFEAAYLEALEAVPVEEIEAARARLAAENAPSVRVEFVNPVQVEGVRAVVENTAAAALAAKQGAQEARRTRETVEQKGAAVAGAIDALGAKFEAVGDEVREQGEATRETVRGEAAATRAELEKYGVESVESLKSALAEIRQQSTALDSDAKGMALLEAQTAAFKAWREFQLASNGKIEMPRKMALRLSMFQKWGDTNGRMQWGQVVQSVTLSRFTQMWKSYERRH